MAEVDIKSVLEDEEPMGMGDDEDVDMHGMHVDTVARVLKLRPSEAESLATALAALCDEHMSGKSMSGPKQEKPDLAAILGARRR